MHGTRPLSQAVARPVYGVRQPAALDAIELRYDRRDQIRAFAGTGCLLLCGGALLLEGAAMRDPWRLLAGAGVALLGAWALACLPGLAPGTLRLRIDAAGVRTAWGALIPWPDILAVRVRRTALLDRLELRLETGWACALQSFWHCPLDELAAVIEARLRSLA